MFRLRKASADTSSSRLRKASLEAVAKGFYPGNEAAKEVTQPGVAFSAKRLEINSPGLQAISAKIRTHLIGSFD